MKRNIFTYAISVAAALLAGCTAIDHHIDIAPDRPENGGEPTNSIDAVCLIDKRETAASRAEVAPLAVRSLIDQITTKQLDSNFLRIDEDVDADNIGTYSFTRGDASYAINWEKAKLLEATVISSPDNTPDRYFRSVSFYPAQTYHIYKAGTGAADDPDTTQFHHTRMIGWYPKTCRLKVVDGAPVETTLDQFTTAYTVKEVDGKKRVALRFTDLDGETDLMVSDAREAQRWHKYGGYFTRDEQWVERVHPSDTYDGTKVYRQPFGHHEAKPAYENYFTYKHYRSAIRIFAWAEKSAEVLSMWGKLHNIVIGDQPTSCTLLLPEQINDNGAPKESHFGEVIEWGEPRNTPIICTPIFGDDSNHPGENLSVEYPVSMEGTSALSPKYLGYSCVQPDAPVRIELHAASGVYGVTIPAVHELKTTVDGVTTTQKVNIFKAGYIYNIYLDLKTDGTIAARLENEGNEHYFDLTRLAEYNWDAVTNTDSQAEDSNELVYQHANCFIVDPTLRTVGLEAKRAAGEPGFDDGREDEYTLRNASGTYDPLPEGDQYYDGYCFAATIVGNGQKGIISSGSQTLYPTSEEITPVKAHLLWESNLGLVTQVELLYGYVRFRVPFDASQAQSNPPRGNAVIAVSDENNRILWSWHIWITDTPQEVDIAPGDATSTTAMLDRNLGATRAAWTGADDVLDTYGLYYQWGRKDPSPGPRSYRYPVFDMITAPYYDYASERKTAAEVINFARPTLKDAVENPLYLILPTDQTGGNYYFNWTYNRYDFLWGYDMQTEDVNKTIYDPCPFGYRVPGAELGAFVSEDVQQTNMMAGRTEYGIITKTKAGEKLYFPYAGYKGVDVGLNSLVCSWRYVGEKADVPTAIVHDFLGHKYHDGHRERIYLSKAYTWKEVSGQSYDGYIHDDFTNRRTASPVRCVKDKPFGALLTTIGLTSDIMYPSQKVDIDFSAISKSEVTSVKATIIGYIQEFDHNHYEIESEANMRVLQTLYDSSTSSDFTPERDWTKTISITAPDLKHLQGFNANFLLRLEAANSHGIKRTAEITIKAIRYTVLTDEWYSMEDTEPIMIGQRVDKALHISSSYKVITGGDFEVRITGYEDGYTSPQTVYCRQYWSESSDKEDKLYRKYILGVSGGQKRSSGNIIFYTPGAKQFMAEISTPVLNPDHSYEKFFGPDNTDKLTVNILDTKATAITAIEGDLTTTNFAIKPATTDGVWLNMSGDDATPTDGKAYYGHLFRLTASGSGYKIRNLATGKYLVGGTSASDSAITCTADDKDIKATVYTIKANADGTFTIGSGNYSWSLAGANTLVGEASGTATWAISTVTTVNTLTE